MNLCGIVVMWNLQILIFDTFFVCLSRTEMEGLSPLNVNYFRKVSTNLGKVTT